MNEGDLDRHQIMKDAIFWVALAYSACGWLRESAEASLRGFWVDDFLPENATDTKRGVDVEGTAWIGNGSRDLHPYRFIVAIPQKMLRRRRDRFSIEHVVLDEARRTLQVEIADEKRAV